MKNEGKKSFRDTIRRLFISLTRKRAKERIDAEFGVYLQKLIADGVPLSKEEMKNLRKEFFKVRGTEIQKEEAKKVGRRVTALALATVLGLGGTGIGAYIAGRSASEIPGITDGKEKIEIDMGEVEKDIEVEGIINDGGEESKRQIFIKGLRDGAINEEVEQNDEYKKQIAQAINSTKDPIEVLNIAKQMYIERYNKEEGKDYTIDDVKFYKTINKNIYVDQAENGDKILRVGKGNVESDRSFITIQVAGEKEVNVAHLYDGDSKTGKYAIVYSEGEQVEAAKENAASELGEVIHYGTTYSIALQEGGHNDSLLKEYKDRYIDSATKYAIEHQVKLEKDNQTNTNQNSKEDGFEPAE